MRNKKLRNQKKKRKNNRGMSLVEVIIAITILGIVIVPVLHSMTASMVYNKKARVRQQLTLTAESIMESFKGYGLDELKTRFSAGGAGIEGVTVSGDGSGYSYTTDGATPENYTFSIKGMEADNGQHYDVEITAKPNTVEDIMVPRSIEPTRDAVFQDDRSYDAHKCEKARADAAKNFRDKHLDALKTAFIDAAANIDTDLEPYLRLNDGTYVKAADNMGNVDVDNHILLKARNLTFEISLKDGKCFILPKRKYTYEFTNYTYYTKKKDTENPSDAYPGESGSVPDDSDEEVDEWESHELTFSGNPITFEIASTSADPDADAIFNNPVPTDNKCGLFIYYYPQYELEDTITITNNTGVDFQCYILKQRTTDLTQTKLITSENGYHPKVKISGSCEVFHNFNDNIGNGSKLTGDRTDGIEEGYPQYDCSDDAYAEQFADKDVVLSYKINLTIKQDGRPITTIESTMSEKIKE